MTSLFAIPEGGNEMDVLAERYRAAFEKTQTGRAQWIEGTLELAAVIIKLRKKYPDHQEYSRWLTRHQLEQFSPNDRRALKGIGEMEPRRARALLEQNEGLSWRVIWEKKVGGANEAPIIRDKGLTSSDRGQNRHKRFQSGAEKRKRNRIPDVMRDDNPPPPKPERKGVVLKALTPKEVDPDFVGTPLEFTTKYGHVLLQTKEQINYHKQQELLMAWIGTVTEFERAGRAMLAALPPVDPAALKEWLAKPGKTDKMQGWSKSIQVACEALYNMISNV